MRRGIATVCLSGTLEQKLVAAAHAGFDGVEIFEPDLIGSHLAPSEIRARAAELGLSIDLYQPFRDFEAVGEAQFGRNLRRAEAKLHLMGDLGATMLLVCSNVADNAIDDDGLAAEQLHALAARAAERGIRVAYEALAWGRRVNEYDHAWRVVQRADHPALGVCLDSFHILSRGSSLDAIADIPAEKLFFLQLADAPHLVMDVLQWSRHYRCFPGQGGFDLADFTARILDAGYAGPLSLEVFNDVFRQADPTRMAVDAMRSLLILEEAITASDQRALPAPPRVPRSPRGSPPSRSRAPTRIARPGAPRPCSRRCWSAAADRVRPTWPRSPRPTAPRCSSAAATNARRRGSGWGTSNPWPPSAIRRLRRSSASTTSRWPSRSITSTRRRCSIARSWGSSRLRHSELAAPTGLVRSRAVTAGDGTVRLALNVPVLAHDSRPEAGPQHVAFACSDIFGVAERMRSRGFVPLAIPDNYYDDLAARTDLEAHVMAALREFRVLYERDRSGEFFHFYAPTVGGRLCFEVVERRGGYDGYGAGNAPVRMAAQRAEAPPVAHLRQAGSAR